MPLVCHNQSSDGHLESEGHLLLTWLSSEKSGCPSNSCPLNLVLPPPPERAQNEEKPYKSVENPQNWHFSRGGERNFMDNDFMDIWAFLISPKRTLEYRSIQIDYRQTLFLGEINFQLQIQNLAARRIAFHYGDRCVGISGDNLSS